MAGTVIAIQPVGKKLASTTPAYVAGASQMELPNQAPTILHMKASGTVTLTVTNQVTNPEGVAYANKTVAMTTGQERMVALDPAVYNMGNGNAQLAFDTPANVTVTAYQIS